MASKKMQTLLIAIAAILCSKQSSSFTSTQQLYFDVSIVTQSDELELGRLTFNLTGPDHRHYLPLHSSNLVNLAMGTRKGVDAKATYEGCMFQFSPATIDDGSFRYKYSHSVDGYGRNAIQTDQADGSRTSFDEPFSDPKRLLECSHECFGGVYYGQQYEEIADACGEGPVVLLTVPIRGPGAGTSKFSVVRVSESPQEWGKRLLLNSACVGYLDCRGDGKFGGSGSDNGDSPTSLEVLRFMARQRYGPPKIVDCGVA